MKVCAICGTPAPDNQPTCPMDGEASWMLGAPPSPESTAPEGVVEEHASGPERPDEGAAARQRKRGRR